MVNSLANNRMLHPKDIKNHLNIGNDKMQKLLHMPGFPVLKIGKRYYIPEQEYFRWIEKNMGNDIIIKSSYR